jgi:hypothetical protein
MSRLWIALLLLTLVTACGRHARMATPENPAGRYQEPIAAAQRLLDQREQWADRVEWEVNESSDGWELTAWRIEHPDRKGPERYLPWGYSVIKLDRRMVPTDYRRKG